MSLNRIYLSLVFSTIIVFGVKAQEISRSIISYDFALQQFDTLRGARYDYSVTKAKTSFSLGDMNSKGLPQDLPIDNLVEGTNFSKPAILNEEQSMTTFPISTTIKLFKVSGDSYRDQCTGVMVSNRHVLTSAHCVLEPYKLNIHANQLVAMAGYNVDMPAAEHISSKVLKMYFIDEWNIGEGDDQALLELAEPIGDYTGWVSIGFNEDDNYFSDKTFQKLSYPTYRTPFNDYPYNGDTLYHAYGPIDYVSDNFLGVVGHLKGAGGESGSSFIYTDNKSEFTSYGVLTWLGNYNHSRFNAERFHAFEQILAPYNRPSDALTEQEESILVFPNPVIDNINVVSINPDIQLDQAELFNVHGQKISSYKFYSNRKQLEFSELKPGSYFLKVIDTEGNSTTKTIIVVGQP